LDYDPTTDPEELIEALQKQVSGDGLDQRRRVMAVLSGDKFGVDTAHHGQETLFTETKAASESEAGAEVPVLCVIRPDLSEGHTGSGMEAGTL